MHMLILLANASILLLMVTGLYALVDVFGWMITLSLVAFALICNAIAIMAFSFTPTTHTNKEYTS